MLPYPGGGGVCGGPVGRLEGRDGFGLGLTEGDVCGGAGGVVTGVGVEEGVTEVAGDGDWPVSGVFAEQAVTSTNTPAAAK